MTRHGRADKTGRLRRSLRSLLLLFLGAAYLTCAHGCTRKFFRLRTDEEVLLTVNEKDKYPQWKVENFHVYPDPMARFADPADPDHPPKPPDDPAAYDLSPNPQPAHKQGVVYFEGNGYLSILSEWDAQNRKEVEELQKKYVEDNPGSTGAKTASITYQELEAAKSKTPPAGQENGVLPPSYTVPPTAQPFLIKFEQAIELGLINNREYQDRREGVYLAALPVTLTRFSFASQFFATETAIRRWTGRELPGGPVNNWQLDTTTGFSKRFATGAMLMLQFANQTVFNLTGAGKHTTSQSTISLDLLQPLLRGGGRAVTLEPLTQAERNLLYEIRSYARFREEFFVSLATGSNIQASSNANSGGAALSLILGFTPQREGYLPTLLEAAQLVDAQKNVTSLENFLKLFESYKEGGDVGQLQVDQVEQQLLSARSNVILQRVQYINRLDRFKIQLGLSPSTPMLLDDTPIRSMQKQLQRFEDVISQFDVARDAATAATSIEQSVAGLSAALSAGPLPGNAMSAIIIGGTEPGTRSTGVLVRTLRPQLRAIAVNTPLVQGTKFKTQFPIRWAEWEKLNDKALAQRLKELNDEQRRLLDKQSDLERLNRNLNEAEKRRLAELEGALDLGQFEQNLRNYEKQIWRKIIDPERRLRSFLASGREVASGFVILLAEARNERLAQVRESWPKLPLAKANGVDLSNDDETAAETAVAQATLINRFDLMNARAQLVDTWRQIAVRANSLMGVANVEYSMSALTPFGANQPFSFNATRVNQQLSLDFELPLTRLAERNTYRATLIGYQQQRRNLMQAEDQALVIARAELRTLRQFAENYKIQQRATELAYLQVESALETFNAPPIPTGASGASGASAASSNNAGNAAALTNQLLQAQQTVVRAQDTLFGFWVNYQVARLQLLKDLELMRLDSRGVWIDESATNGPGPNGQSECGSAEYRGVVQGLPERLPEPGKLPEEPQK